MLNIPGTIYAPARFGNPSATYLPQMPSGALGVWFMDAYQTSPRNYVPNAVQTVPYAAQVSSPHNLLSAARHRFSDTNFYSQNGSVTTVDSAVAGPNGLTDAATVGGGATDWSISRSVANLPAGTYTVVSEIMSNTGSDQTCKVGKFGSESVVTATAAGYTREKSTFTIGAPTTAIIIPVRANASAAGSIRLWETCLYSGSSDLGPENLVGHMVFGGDAFNAQPTYASGVLTLAASGKFGVVQFDDYTNLTEYSVMAIGRRKGAAGGFVQSYIGKIGNVTLFGGAFSDQNIAPKSFFAGNTVYQDSSAKQVFWNYDTTQWLMVGDVYDGSGVSMWRNDIKMYRGTGSGYSQSIRDLWVGIVNATSQFSNYDLHAIVIYPRALSDSEMRAAFSALSMRASASSIVIGDRHFLNANGDSITWEYNATNGYVRRFIANASPQVDGTVSAVPSATLLTAYEIGAGNSLQTRESQDDAMLPPQKNGRKFVMSILVGNDFVNGYTDGTAYAADVAAYAGRRKAAGWDKVLLGTILPRTAAAGGANFNTYRNAFNAVVTGAGWAAANNIDGIFDFAADATMGPDAAASNATYYGDGVHPTNAGHAILEPIYTTAVNAAFA